VIGDTTVKLTRRWKRSDEVRNERRSEAVDGRVQRLVVLPLMRCNCIAWNRNKLSRDKEKS
jgi:hypothetical protein